MTTQIIKTSMVASEAVQKISLKQKNNGKNAEMMVGDRWWNNEKDESFLREMMGK